jgi:hypothetical protein
VLKVLYVPPYRTVMSLINANGWSRTEKMRLDCITDMRLIHRKSC